MGGVFHYLRYRIVSLLLPIAERDIMEKVELLAPAGNYESFLGAIHAGADAVYLGGDKFGARAFAENFTTEQLCSAIKYAHLFNRKVYLTLNTLIKEKEFDELYSYIKPFYEAGLDGIIIQDLGVFSYVRRCFPKLPLHVSTQMTVTGVYAAKMLKEEGAVRIVPARELSLKEIREIKSETGLEMETFIHGAMCYCYSGQCLFSSFLGGRSGNRGKCAQPCRLPYEVLEKGKPVNGEVSSFPLSLKDMCTIEHIPDLIEAGIDSFKIEGRMKKPEYAAGVTAIYRKYIDLYYKKGRAGYKVSKEDISMLEALYIRSEIQDGYYYRHNGREMITRGTPGYSGSDETVLGLVRNRFLDKQMKLPVKMQAYFHKESCAILTLSQGDVYVTVNGQTVQKAMKQPVTEQNIREGLSALGESFFELTDLEIDAEDDIFYPLKAIKDLRREGIELLEKALEKENCPHISDRVCVCPENKREKSDCLTFQEKNRGLRVLVSNEQQLSAVLNFGKQVERIYLDGDLCRDEKEWQKIFDKLSSWRKEKKENECCIALPYILRKRDNTYLEQMKGVLEKADGCLVRNMEGYAFLKENGYEKPVYGDAGLYQWNKECTVFWSDKLSGYCLPYELSGKEQLQIVDNDNWEQVVYGRLPMMVTANCIANTSKGCQLKNGEMCAFSFSLKDRYKTEFPVYVNCRHCYNVIYNSVPLSLHEKVSEKKMKAAIRLDFTTENNNDVIKILEYFVGLKENNGIIRPYEQFTTGHEKKGAL